MNNSIHYLHPDNFFTQEDKEVLLKIPHKVIKVHPKIEVIDFNTPENGKYPMLRNITISKISDVLSSEELNNFEIRKHIYGSQYHMGGEIEGLFINSNNGSSIQDLIKELYKYDKEYAQELAKDYHNFAVTCNDIIFIEERFIRQLKQVTQYLIKEKIEVVDLGIDFSSHSKKSDREQELILNQLESSYGEGYNFPAYNDLDYTPFMHNNDYYMYDISGARLYVVKNIEDTYKIYMIDAMRECNIHISDWFNDFAYAHKQEYLLLAKNITEANLIGEIKCGKLTKASENLTTFDLLQSCIVDTLYEDGKIENIVPKLTFEELLDNYTLENESYQIKERAFLEMFNHLQLFGDILTYQGFSVMKESDNLKIKHEDFSLHIAKNLKERLQQKDNLKIKDLPQEYKEQINNYLNSLTEKYNNETTKLIVQYVKDEMNGVAKKLKR